MTGEISFDKYRKKVILENKISKEQEFILNNIDEDEVLNYNSPIYSPSPEQIILTTKNNKNETPIDIDTTKDIIFSPRFSPTISLEESIYEQYSTIILITVGVVAIIMLFGLYAINKPKKFDFFN